MGDTENAIEYSPAELEEIDRIIGSIEASNAPVAVAAPPPPAEDEFPSDEDLEFPEELSGDQYIGEPEDLDLPMGDIEAALAGGDEYEEEAYEDTGEGEGIDEFDLPGEDLDLSGLDDLTAEETATPEEELLDVSQDEIEDITDILEIRDEGEDEALDFADLEEEPAEPSGELEEMMEGLEDEGLIMEEEILDELEGLAEEGPALAEEEPGGSPLDQLSALTADEPESLDISDISDDRYFDDEVPAEKEETAFAGDEDFKDEELPDLQFDMEPSGEGPAEMQIDKEELGDIPDLSDISFEDAEAIPEASDDDIPDIDIGDLAGEESISFDEAPGAEEEIMTFDETGFDDMSDEDLVDLGDIHDASAKSDTTMRVADIEDDIPDVGISEGDLDDIDKIDIGTIESDEKEEPLTVEPLDEEPYMQEPPPEKGRPETGEGIDLSDRELKRLKRAILLFNPSLIQVIKDVIVNDLLPVRETRQLVDMILSGKSEDAVHRYLEKKLARSIDLTAETAQGRRVLYSRTDYTRAGRERQKRLLKVTKIFGTAAVLAFVATILGYQFVYKPYMAKKMILEGASIIRSRGDYTKKPADYQRAEGIFRDVQQNYREKYLFGYNTYSRAYLDVKEYGPALKKLNEAYEIDPRNVETLNALGHYYARVPEQYFRTLQGSLNGWYYRGEKKEVAQKPQVDIAIEFYRRALLKDKDNINSLVGIGDAYYQQGQFLKAKKYYEDILKVDDASPLGFAGLLNLYIEKDSFEQVASLHAQIRDKKLLGDLPSPLLGKLAEYYLSKTRQGDRSIRIDYGVHSPRLVDKDDNTYPAVQAVLMTLNQKDPDYPPLQVHSARLNRQMKNYKIMEKYLQRALDKAPNYFGALHLMGEYYYDNKEPVKAYEFLTKAIASYNNQPAFTREPFYRETENIGKTHALLGNIFYYFFDKVRYRYGDLEDEEVDSDADRFINYAIAKAKYEEALALGYNEPEIHYNLGRIYYLKKMYRQALDQWLNLYEDFVSKPELMFALGNAFYHMGNYEAAKGEYLKLANVLEMEADGIRVVQQSNTEHIKIFKTLSSLYNNLGAIYQIQRNESKSGISYWKSVEYAKKLESENEYARINLARSFNRKDSSAPIIDEDIPFGDKVYRQ